MSKQILLALSMCLNVFLAINWLWPISRLDLPSMLHEQPEEGWSKSAAAAAEQAAQFDCNGNGDLYVDTFDFDEHEGASNQDLQQCECYECFTGPHCADIIPNCTADVDSGNPQFLAPYWKVNAEAGTVVIPAWYRSGYTVIEGDSTPTLPALEKEIRRLHNIVGNAIVDGKYILVGTGSTQLLNAAVESLSSAAEDPANVVAAVPYFGAYEKQTKLFATSSYLWAGDALAYAELQGDSNSTSVEFVTSPNNPDGTVRTAVVNGRNAHAIYDLAYYWPHFTAITGAHDHDVMIFTLSKLTGHAGSRIGWVIVKDYSIFTKLRTYLQLNIMGVSHESQMRATQLLRAVNSGYSKGMKPSLNLPANHYASEGLIFHYAYRKLRERWEKLVSILGGSTRFRLQHLEPQHCEFFNETTGPSPGYAWIHCELEEDQNCTSVFYAAGIVGRSGTSLGDTEKYIRLSLLKRDAVIANLMEHLALLASNEQRHSCLATM